MPTELHLKYRPEKLDHVLGQDPAVKTLKSWIAANKVPHAVLFHGHTGCGKTTMARILANELGVGEGDLQEVNCGTLESPIDTVRAIQRQMNLMGMSGKRRMWILDEVQSLSRARYAQEGLLKILEEPPSHSYFALCTTDPQKIIKAVKGRCQPIQVKGMTPQVLTQLVNRTLKREKRVLSQRVIDKVVELANGAARNTLVYLEQALTAETEEEQLAAIAPTEADAAAFDLVKALMPWKGKPSWRDVAPVLERLKEEDPEGLRMMVLNSARSRLLKDGNPQMFNVLVAFEEPFHYSLHAGLCRAAFEVCNAK